MQVFKTSFQNKAFKQNFQNQSFKKEFKNIAKDFQTVSNT